MNSSGHTAFTQIPVVDISRLFSDSCADRKAAARGIDKAARDVGFLYVEGHGIAPESIQSLLKVAKRYFSLSDHAKMKNYIGLSKNHTGYVPQGEEEFATSRASNPNIDLKEGYDIGPSIGSLMKRYSSDAETLWPEDKEFEQTVSEYYQLMLDLSKVLFRGFALGLDVPEDAFLAHLTSPPSQLRLLHYFDNPHAKENDTGIGAHTDYEFFTILLPTAPGLQVVNGLGNWIDVPVRENCFVLNIGDMMELVTNGAYKATTHRVKQVKEERYSFPFFASLDYDTLVKPLEKFESADQNRFYNPVICGDHLLSKTITTFRYLKQRLNNAEIKPPDKIDTNANFGRIDDKGRE